MSAATNDKEQNNLTQPTTVEKRIEILENNAIIMLELIKQIANTNKELVDTSHKKLFKGEIVPHKE